MSIPGRVFKSIDAPTQPLLYELAPDHPATPVRVCVRDPSKQCPPAIFIHVCRDLPFDADLKMMFLTIQQTCNGSPPLIESSTEPHVNRVLGKQRAKSAQSRKWCYWPPYGIDPAIRGYP